MMEKFFVTTPIYYANALPHIGHAYTTIKADCIARFNVSLGKDVFLSVGMDEHGLKVENKAKEKNKNPQNFVDEISKNFIDLWTKLNIGYAKFIRTTDDEHEKAVKKVLNTLFEKGAIYKGIYKGLYCVGCEQFITNSQLVDGKCPDHGTEPEEVEEESYLLKMSDIQKKLIEKIESNKFKITPDKRKNEILSFLKKEKLEDTSISRKNVSWGIPLPFDKEHTTYVWVDGFLNYLTVLGWEGDEHNLPKHFPPNLQIVGKDILRVHATIWPAILIHLGLPLPKELYVHGHILSGGRKMSKTLGNTIDPLELVTEYGADATRYFLMREIPSFEDGDITKIRFKEVYNAHLANGLGNLTSRILKMSESYLEGESTWVLDTQVDKEFQKFMEQYDFNKALEFIWEKVAQLDARITETEPFKLIKTDKEKAKSIVRELVQELFRTAQRVEPFMPETAMKIQEAIKTNKPPQNPIFPRKE